MEDALIFATIVHEVKDYNKSLPIIVARKKAELTTADDKIKRHLAKAQGIITATRLMVNSSLALDEFKSYVQQSFNHEYIGLMMYSKSNELSLPEWESKENHSLSLTQWEQEARDLSNLFTLDFDRRVKRIFYENLSFKRSGISSYIGFTEPATELTALTFRQLVLRNCTPDPKMFAFKGSTPSRTTSGKPASHRAMRIVTDNGLIIERGSNGSVKLIPQRPVQIGGMYLGPGSVMQGGTGLYMGPIQLSADQTEKEFLAAISVFSAIVEKTYI